MDKKKNSANDIGKNKEKSDISKAIDEINKIKNNSNITKAIEEINLFRNKSEITKAIDEINRVRSNSDILQAIEKLKEDRANSEISKAIDAIKSINSLALDYTSVTRVSDDFNNLKNITFPPIASVKVPTYQNFFPSFEPEYDSKIENIKTELNELNTRNKELITDLKNEQINSEEKNRKIEELTKNILKIQDDTKLIHITSRIHQKAAKRILEDETFRSNFRSNDEFEAAVISIDIRRSTDLMLEANTPLEYSNFILDLTEGLKECIINNFGIFDKFTGDGILAFFPKFYSGIHSIFFAQKAAQDAHNIFHEVYKKHRKSFSLVLSDVGLGIGIDFGKVNLYQTNSDFSIVGKPVVYACRFSSTKAFSTLNNQGALTEISNNLPENNFESKESILELKNKGNCIGHSIKIDWKKITIETPNW